MMGGSFGLELNPATIPDEDRAALPDIIALAEKVNPIVVSGDVYRLRSPEVSNWPAVLFLSEDGSQGVLFYFQLSPSVNHAPPRVRLQGLDPHALYKVGNGTYSGATLMNFGLQFQFETDVGSTVVFLDKL